MAILTKISPYFTKDETSGSMEKFHGIICPYVVVYMVWYALPCHFLVWYALAMVWYGMICIGNGNGMHCLAIVWYALAMVWYGMPWPWK